MTSTTTTLEWQSGALAEIARLAGELAQLGQEVEELGRDGIRDDVAYRSACDRRDSLLRAVEAAGRAVVGPITARYHSRNLDDIREDFTESLRAALADTWGANEAKARAIVESLVDYRDKQRALREVRSVFGAAVFGRVTLYHLEKKTSLMGDSEVLTTTGSLTTLGLTVKDLGWPDEALHPAYLDGKGVT